MTTVRVRTGYLHTSLCLDGFNQSYILLYPTYDLHNLVYLCEYFYLNIKVFWGIFLSQLFDVFIRYNSTLPEAGDSGQYFKVSLMFDKKSIFRLLLMRDNPYKAIIYNIKSQHRVKILNLIVYSYIHKI